MSSNPYYSNFYPEAESDSPAEGSLLKSNSFVLRHVPDRSDQSKVSFDMISGKVRESGENKKEIARLHSAMTALLPQLKDLQDFLFDLDDRVKILRSQASDASKIRDGKAENLCFLATWMEQRCMDAFDHIVKLNPLKMPAAAALFKPMGTESFIKDMGTNANVLRLIPHAELTPEICLRAVQLIPSTLMHIPEKLRTYDLCLAAMSVEENGGGALQHVPASLRTPEMCEAAVKSNFSNLQFVVDKTKDLCIEACLKSGLAWDLVPKELRSLEVEYAASLHRFGDRTPEMILKEMEKALPETFKETVEKLERAFVKIHYSSVEEDDLEDLGWPREYAH